MPASLYAMKSLCQVTSASPGLGNSSSSWSLKGIPLHMVSAPKIYCGYDFFSEFSPYI